METHVKIYLTKEEVEGVLQAHYSVDPSKSISVKIYRTGEYVAEITQVPKKEEAPKEATQGE